MPAVIADIRENRPDLDLLVIDDGSTDGTLDVIAPLGVRWMRLAGADGYRQRDARRPAVRRAPGYDAAVRLDGDGQHRASDIRPHPGADSGQARADVVLGSRLHVVGRRLSRGRGRIVKRVLSVCLTALTGRVSPIRRPDSARSDRAPFGCSPNTIRPATPNPSCGCFSIATDSGSSKSRSKPARVRVAAPR